MSGECIAAGFSFTIGKFFAGLAIMGGILGFLFLGGVIWLFWPRGK